MDRSHLDALELRLSHERARLDRFAPVNRAGGSEQRRLRLVWIAQIEREIAAERAFLGLGADEAPDLSDAELLAEMGA